MVAITKIVVNIGTGAQDPDKDTRIFLGFQGFGGPFNGREFRLRKGNDANPFRQNSSQTLTFGVNNDIKNPTLNDPANPQLDDNAIFSTYIRVSPQSTESWLISNATVSLFADPSGGTLSSSWTLPAPITLQEDAGEIVYLI
jgi:hypothetical protein